jgi:hypothetical protein
MEIESSLAAKFAALFPHLDERHRRLTMRAESRVLGHGGVTVVARAAGVSRVTVTGGVRELEAGEEPLGRTRRSGGGRKSVTKTDPGVKAALLALVEPESRGDPMSPLRVDDQEPAQAGNRAGRAGPQGVGADRRSAAAGGELQPARQRQDHRGRAPSRPRRPVRPHQHRGRAAHRRRSAGDQRGRPENELVGNFSNGGQEYRPAGDPVQTNVYDFKGELGKVTPLRRI